MSPEEPCTRLRLLPQPRVLTTMAGTYAIGQPVIEISSQASALARILPQEWHREFGQVPTVCAGSGAGFYFLLGNRGNAEPFASTHPESYSLRIGGQGIMAEARTEAGLLYAWQTLKQILRANPLQAPALVITDEPDLRWRVYHLDLKGTRRTLANLHAILPLLAELKINAVLAEYEDYIRLDRHPGLAVPQALRKDEVKAWIDAARDYNVTVIPLVQTLAHLHYVLRHPDYIHLQEKPGDPAEACPTHPDTWPLIRDLLDELMELHAGLPFFHIGLDETFNIGTCPRCLAALGGRSKMDLYVEWENRCCRHVRERGFAPIAWGGTVSSLMEDEQVRELDRSVTFIASSGYPQTRLLTPAISREWLKRPVGTMDEQPRIGFTPGKVPFEDLKPEQQERIRPYAGNPEFPKYTRADASIAMLAGHGLKTGGLSGIRVSFHGCVAPKFITGQLNTLLAAEICRMHHSEMVIGSSWSRGHSLAGMNAHPELDWYGIATLGAASWGPVTMDDLQDFDRRFAFQFFGLPDGHIGDLFYLFERSSPRVDHVMDNYIPHILGELAHLAPLVARNAEKFALFQMACRVQDLRYKAQFANLELEYFYAMWDRVPADFKARIQRGIQETAAEIERTKAEARTLYSQTLLSGDASEMADTQLDYFRDMMLLMAGRQFPG
jgi:hypothetical protein